MLIVEAQVGFQSSETLTDGVATITVFVFIGWDQISLFVGASDKVINEAPDC